MFAPARRRGLILQGIAVVLFGAISLGFLNFAFQQPVGTLFTLSSLAGLLLAVPACILIYRIFELIRSSYSVTRDGLHLRWGARSEVIPINAIDWIRPYASLTEPLPLPPFVWPGALRGVVSSRDLGQVEYMADDMDTLLLVATPTRVYAISPSRPQEFIAAFNAAVEEGSLQELPPRSERSVRSLRETWADRPAMLLLGAGLVTCLAVFVVTGLGIGRYAQVSLGFDLRGDPFPPVPASQAMLLPVLAALIFLLDAALGLITYRFGRNRAISYILWAGGLLSSLLLLLSAIFVLSTPQL